MFIFIMPACLPQSVFAISLPDCPLLWVQAVWGNLVQPFLIYFVRFPNISGLLFRPWNLSHSAIIIWQVDPCSLIWDILFMCLTVHVISPGLINIVCWSLFIWSLFVRNSLMLSSSFSHYVLFWTYVIDLMSSDWLALYVSAFYSRTH